MSSLANVGTKAEEGKKRTRAETLATWAFSVTQLSHRLSVLCYAGPKKGTSNQSVYAVKEDGNDSKRPRLLTDYGKSYVFLRQAHNVRSPLLMPVYAQVSGCDFKSVQVECG